MREFHGSAQEIRDFPQSAEEVDTLRTDARKQVTEIPVASELRRPNGNGSAAKPAAKTSAKVSAAAKERPAESPRFPSPHPERPATRARLFIVWGAAIASSARSQLIGALTRLRRWPTDTSGIS